MYRKYPPQPAHLQSVVRLHRELRAAPVARRSGARQGLAAGQDARATSGSSSPTCGCCTATCGAIPARSCCSWAASSARSASGSTTRASSGTCCSIRCTRARQRWVRDLNRVLPQRAGAVRARLQRRRFRVDRLQRCGEQRRFAFLRKGKRSEDLVLVVCNFTPVRARELSPRRAARRALARVPEQRRSALRRRRPGQLRRRGRGSAPGARALLFPHSSLAAARGSVPQAAVRIQSERPAAENIEKRQQLDPGDRYPDGSSASYHRVLRFSVIPLFSVAKP